MGNALKADISANVIPALREWWRAVRELRENPVYRLGRRTSTGASRARMFAVVGWSGLLLLFLFAARFLVPVLFAQLDKAYFLPLSFAMAIAGWLLAWMGNGVYNAALFTLRILADPRLARGGQLQLEEAALASRISDREIIVALVALALPKLWIRQLAAPVALLAVWGLLKIQGIHEPTQFSLTVAEQLAQRQVLLTAALANLPGNMLAMYLAGAMAALILLLWLLTLGRGLTHVWHLPLLGFSASIVQFAWMPLMLLVISRWSIPVRISTSSGLVELLLAIVAMLASLTASLHFSRRRPLLRLLLSALVPPFLLAAGVTYWRYLLATEPWHRKWLGELFWAFGAGVVANPFAVSARGLGLPDVWGQGHWLLEWFRLPLLLLVQAVAVAICAHAAHLAVADWRRSEQ